MWDWFPSHSELVEVIVIVLMTGIIHQLGQINNKLGKLLSLQLGRPDNSW